VGQTVTVEGRLAAVFNNGQAVYLTFREPHQGTFIARILRQDRRNFPAAPERMYTAGQVVQVRGRLGWYQGAPVIVVRSPAQIRVVERSLDSVPAAR